jgi:hypothetical protein
LTYEHKNWTIPIFDRGCFKTQLLIWRQRHEFEMYRTRLYSKTKYAEAMLKSNYSSEAVVRSMYQLHSRGHCWSIRSSHHVIYNYATTLYLWENLKFATCAISLKPLLFARFVRLYRCIKSQKCIESMSKQNVLHVLPSDLTMYQFENRVHTRPLFNWFDNHRSPLPFSCSTT